MHHDLIFHIVEKNNWKAYKEGGEYIPDSIEQEGFIHCSTGFQINEIANRNFKDKRHLWLLIIDANRLKSPLKYEEDPELNKEFPHIYGPLNLDAILDKISLNPDKKGNFDLDFTSS